MKPAGRKCTYVVKEEQTNLKVLSGNRKEKHSFDSRSIYPLTGGTGLDAFSLTVNRHEISTAYVHLLDSIINPLLRKFSVFWFFKSSGADILILLIYEGCKVHNLKKWIVDS